MRARGSCIHLCGCSLTVIVAKVHCTFHLFNRVNHDPLQVLHIEALIFILAHIKLLWLASWSHLLLVRQQVKDILLVDLQVADPHEILRLNLRLFCILVDHAEYVCKTVRNYTAKLLFAWIAHHRVGFAAPSLSVREYRTVISLQHRFYQRECNLIIDGLLEGVSIVDSIESERLGHGAFLVNIGDCDVFVLSVTRQATAIT